MGAAVGHRLDEPHAAHTSGITTALILAHVENCGGREAVGAVLRKIDRADREDVLRDERSWWSWDTKIALFEAAAEVLHDDRVTYNAGRTALETGVAAPLKAALRALGSPSLVYTNIIRANHKFSTASRMVMEEMGGHRARVRYEHLVDVVPHRLDCLYNQGLLSCVPMLFDLPPARIEHPICAMRGGDECVYEITWQPQLRPSWRAMLGSGLGAIALVAGAGAVAPDLGFAVAGAGAAALAWHGGRRRQDVVAAVARLERELDVRTERSDRIRASLHALSSAIDHDEVVARITEYAAQALGGHDCVLLLEDERGWHAQPSPAVAESIATDLERWVATGPEVLQAAGSIDDLTNVPVLAGLPALRPPVASLCAAPLVAHGQRLGLLVALAQRPFSFLPQELSILELFAEQASIALFNAKLYAAQQEMASRDPLTGLRNHREFHETVERELARCRRSAARFSVALLDLDGFKSVNDGAGHAAGDRLLQEVGAAMEAASRAGDIAFRVGGDEFAVLLPESGTEEADAAVRRIVVAGSLVDDRVGVSWGVATWPADGIAKEQVLATADERLYEMKRARGARPSTRPEDAFLSTLAALVQALESKDEYTASHAHGVAHLAESVAVRLGLDGDDLRRVAHAALLHDIGKIAIPTEILIKDGPLTEDEFEVIKSHAAVGGGMVARIPGLEPVAPLVRHAHERWDGGGYPDGLAGEDIPLGARIIAVCDAFHAMTSDRPYRRALEVDEATVELELHAGTQFDAAVVAALLHELSAART
jgi:diguanylate cyclase (GGDEF)-like protein